MSAQEQIERLRTIQESMHDIADKVVSLGDGSVMLNDVADGKKQIADAINTKGGSAVADSSFSQLAEDIESLPTSGILATGVTQTEPFNFVDYVTKQINSEITSINSDIEVIERSYAFYYCISLCSVELPNLATISGGGTFYACTSLQSVELPNLATISGDDTFYGCSSLQRVEFPNLVTISRKSTFNNCSSLQNIELPTLAAINESYTFNNCSSLQNVQIPNLVTLNGSYTFFGCQSLQNVQLGTLIVCSEPFSRHQQNLRNITIGQDTNINLPFQNWTATNVIAEGQSGIDELNSNLYNNLLTKLYDHSTDGQTRTLRLGWLAYVTQENIDYANSKGWTLIT